LAPGGDEQLGVNGGDGGVIDHDRDEASHVIDESLAATSAPSIDQFDADEQLGDGDRGDGDLIVVSDGIIEREARAVGVDEKGRVQEQPAQGLASISSSDRTEATSLAKPGSTRCRRSSALTSAPVPVVTGSS
jgi:hypothetical protein